MRTLVQLISTKEAKKGEKQDLDVVSLVKANFLCFCQTTKSSCQSILVSIKSNNPSTEQKTLSFSLSAICRIAPTAGTSCVRNKVFQVST